MALRWDPPDTAPDDVGDLYWDHYENTNPPELLYKSSAAGMGYGAGAVPADWRPTKERPWPPSAVWVPIPQAIIDAKRGVADAVKTAGENPASTLSGISAGIQEGGRAVGGAALAAGGLGAALLGTLGGAQEGTRETPYDASPKAPPPEKTTEAGFFGSPMLWAAGAAVIAVGVLLYRGRG